MKLTKYNCNAFKNNLNFNNLNCIVGSHGSGKTKLLNSISELANYIKTGILPYSKHENLVYNLEYEKYKYELDINRWNTTELIIDKSSSEEEDLVIKYDSEQYHLYDNILKVNKEYYLGNNHLFNLRSEYHPYLNDFYNWADEFEYFNFSQRNDNELNEMYKRCQSMPNVDGLTEELMDLGYIFHGLKDYYISDSLAKIINLMCHLHVGGTTLCIDDLVGLDYNMYSKLFGYINKYKKRWNNIIIVSNDDNMVNQFPLEELIIIDDDEFYDNERCMQEIENFSYTGLSSFDYFTSKSYLI